MIKSVFITGANGGIGKALCETYSLAGYYVIATDLQEEPTHEHCNEYREIDLAKYASDKEYRKQTEAELNEFNPEILINNAAVQLLGEFADYSIDDWRTTFDVNLNAAYLLIKKFYFSLKEHKGQVINIASIHGRLTKPGFFAYATSKAAMIGMTTALAVEFKGAITVNAVSPAAIATDMLRAGFENDQNRLDGLAELHPSQVLGDPKQLAEFIFSVTAQNNRFVNGTNLEVDGGISGALLDLEH